MNKPKVALIRGRFLNQFDMQSYIPLSSHYDITAFASQNPMHVDLPFPVALLTSPTDLPEFSKKMPLLNRLFVDANYLFGLENRLKGFAIAHTAETYYHYTHQALLAKRKKHVKKVITTVWENIPFNNEGIWGRKKFKEDARNEIDHFIAVSELAKKALVQEGTDPEKISVVTPGIDIRKFFPEKNHFEKIGNKKKELTILFVGRFEVYKGVMDILEAAVDLKNDKKLSTYTLNYIFVGQGSQKENMKNYAKLYGLDKNIMYMTADYGSIPEVYTMADIFVAPSKKDKYWQEQYGMMLLEAQASGLPIVTTSSGAIPENIKDAGIMIGEGEVKELGEAIKEFIFSPEKRVQFGQKARKRAEKFHDVSIFASKIDKIYKDVLFL